MHLKIGRGSPPSLSVFGSSFQILGAAKQKARLANIDLGVSLSNIRRVEGRNVRVGNIVGRGINYVVNVLRSRIRAKQVFEMC